MHAGLVACWLIRFMVVLLYSIGLIVAYLPFRFMWVFMMCVGIYAPLPHDNKRRMRSNDRDIKSDGVDGEWTEHFTNSRGRTFFFNKKLEVKQLETPKGMVKR